MQRRFFVTLLSASAVMLPTMGFAINEAGAKRLVDGLVGQINKVIASGKSETAMFREFERILVRYGDMATIAQSTLGRDGRGATSAQKRSYQKALQGYIARKYGKRFREFMGGKVEVRGVKKVNRYYEVNCVAQLRGESPFALDFMVSDRSGKDLFFDMKIEGVSLLLTERREIGALLDRRRGDINALTQDLKRMG